MRLPLIISNLVLLAPPFCLSQEPNKGPLIVVVGHGWYRARQAAKKTDGQATAAPMRAMTSADRNFQRTARDQLNKTTFDPNEGTTDGRTSAIEKAVQESRSPKFDDILGYVYTANVRNDGSKKATVIFWEYRFTELAKPANIIRRQFLCSANIKAGESRELLLFSQLGPSDVIGVESLAAQGVEKIFDEKVLINRIEFADGTMLQRGNWKYDDYQKSIEQAISTPWGKEVCRGF